MRINRKSAVIAPEPTEGFVETPKIKEVIGRALTYLRSGFAVHFCGPTGSGKTTLATHLAYQLGQPVMLMFGDEEFATSDLVGGSFGYRKRKLIDNFIHSVLKTEEDVMQSWVDNRLTTAVKEGFTLIYDEFNRSRPEANNALLSVLEEGILTLPTAAEEEGYLKAHPNFRAIFTSNPEEYAGVQKTQDALLDRMVTIHLDYFDEETERAIVASRSGISLNDAARIIKILREFRKINGLDAPVTLRPGIVIGTILKQKGKKVSKSDPLFTQICIDALISGRNKGKGIKKATKLIKELIEKHAQEGKVRLSFPAENKERFFVSPKARDEQEEFVAKEKDGQNDFLSKEKFQEKPKSWFLKR